MLLERNHGERAADLRVRRRYEAKVRMRSARHTLERLSNEVIERFLDPRERKVLRLRLGLEDGRLYTQEEVGIELNVGRERVRQIQNQALKNLAGKGGRRS